MTTAEEIHDQQDKNWRFMVARANRFEAALKAIRDCHLGDCPAAQDELTHAKNHIADLRKIAWDTLEK